MNNNNSHPFSNYTVLESRQIPAGAISKKFMSGVFLWMFIALGVSAIVSLLFASNLELQSSLYKVVLNKPSFTSLGMFIVFAPILFVIIMSVGFRKLSSPVLTLLLVLFAAVMGMSLSTIFITYTAGSLLTCFASASIMFGVMAVMGYTTDKDLTTFGSFLTMGLVGIIIASMVNMFLHSTLLGYISSFVGVAVFLGLTAYDVQKLKRIGAGIEFQEISANDTQKLIVMGALSLYLDFINLFLLLLQLFGNKRNND
ncbi:BAX inhibitor (BI)-1/YccA family protein [Flavipsychrobacter stenotrophus]|uniref:BAX inhibitor (BI)-1/YccA family protein n=1 Tax=Flavipsychrobacter stenotrophus TaxID=2077091 RepID=A0A2S7STE3_9BACT|nr:Bax inhibitor-1/YccA family protein [Flavipsychrobacter stenotrophus]PQJ10202.1 BAX inhibitor (BI)-1/YccA family protein [Flavipsychrobacter stenotrophus]